MKEKVTIAISGGHLTPALALIEEIRKTRADWQIVFLGRYKGQENSDLPSEESEIIKGLQIAFEPIRAGRLNRFINLKSIKSIFRIPLGIYDSIQILKKYQVNISVSFGGYVGLAVVAASKILGIPSLIHEQTESAGLANKISAKLCQKICIASKNSALNFPPDKTVYTGMPVRTIIFNPPISPSFSIPTGDVIYIVGGVNGAKFINDLIYSSLTVLLNKFIVVHQTGKAWINQAEEVKNNIPSNNRQKYIPRSYLNGPDHSYLLHRAVMVIGRSGANTVSDIGFCAVPSIFIPLPWSAGNEQMKNARLLKEAGSAEIIPQETAQTENLIAAVNKMTASISIYRNNAKTYRDTKDSDGAKNLLTEIIKLSPK